MNDLITNGTEIKQRILAEVGAAKQCGYIAMAWFTDRDIATAIIDAKNRRVDVDVILSSNVQNDIVKLMFKGAGVNVHAFETGDSRGIMHHKFCLIDKNISINGSYNYSYNASSNNVENVYISDDVKIYDQFFTEFERLKYNIDHNIAVNNTIPVIEQKPVLEQPVNFIDNFSKQLHNLIYSSTQISTEEYQKRGYETSKDNSGNIDIFRTECDIIKEEVRSFSTEDGLNNTKNILKSNILNAFQSASATLKNEQEEKEATAKRDINIDVKQLEDKILELKNDKTIFESGNQATAEPGLLQINKDIEKNKLERKAIELSFVTKKLWSGGTVVIGVLLTIFICYLSVFFASALYKMLFESDQMRAAMEAGNNPGLPKLVDANAIIKLFKHEGAIFGFIGLIFFLFPILLSNVKLLGSERKWVNGLLFWVGLLVFDFIVAGMIAINTDEMKSLLIGKESQIAIWEVVKKGEFWMIFMFGMVPLIITHYLIENINKAYRNSKVELIDREKHKLLQILDGEMIELNAQKESIIIKIAEKDSDIKGKQEKVLELESD